eukprot:g22085.t1
MLHAMLHAMSYQQRTVTCVSSTTGNVDDYFCIAAGLSKSGAVQQCNMGPCPVYKWISEAWSACSVACGSGQRTRSVTCRDIARTPSVLAQDWQCSSTDRPSDSELCSNYCYVYEWWKGDWSSCSVNCGTGGKQTRAVSCIVQGTGGQWPQASWHCDGLPKPLSEQDCNPPPPLDCNTYLWNARDWGECQKVCGGGTRTRQVWCVAQAAQDSPVSEIKCTGLIKPATSEACNTQDCPPTWRIGTWGPCSVSCGGGTQNREVWCENEAQKRFGDADCLATAPKPQTSRECNLLACPKWLYKPWSVCSVTCGTGTQTRETYCADFNNLPVSNDQCSQSLLPLSQICKQPDCPIWSCEGWGSCSNVCGGGEKTRQCVCVRTWFLAFMTYKEIVANEQCASLPPPQTKTACTVEESPPCPAYYYTVSRWSTCPKPCKKDNDTAGVQYRIVECFGEDENKPVSETLCQGAVKPPSEQYCNTQPCPRYQWWNASEWSTCSANCGTGATSLLVECRQYLGDANFFKVMSDESLCGPNKPENSKTCIAPKNCSHGQCKDRQCKCEPGWGGTFCEDEPKLSNLVNNINNEYAAGLPFRETVRIDWTSEGDMPTVYILLRNPAWILPQVLEENFPNKPGKNSYLWSVSHVLPAGRDYYLQIWFSPNLTVRSDNFSVADGSLYATCSKHGTPNYNGTCRCLGSYSGPECEVAPCERAQCNIQHSNCSNEGERPGVCECHSGFAGPRCYVPVSCLHTPATAAHGNQSSQDGFVCLNGGLTHQGLTASPDEVCSALSCTCINHWRGDRCENCSLVCANGFRPDPGNCRTCMCGAGTGWTNSKCDCRFYTMQMLLVPPDQYIEGMRLLLTQQPKPPQSKEPENKPDASFTSNAMPIFPSAGVPPDTAENAGGVGGGPTDQLQKPHQQEPSPEWERFRAAFVADLTNTLGVSTQRVRELVARERPSAPGQPVGFILSFWLLDDCLFLDEPNAMEAGSSTAVALAKSSRRRLVQASTRQGEGKMASQRRQLAQANSGQGQQGNSTEEINGNLEKLYNLTKKQLGDADSPLYRGVVSRFLDPDYLVCTSCPAAPLTEAPPPPPACTFKDVSKHCFVEQGWILLAAVVGGLCIVCPVCFALQRCSKQRQLNRDLEQKIAKQASMAPKQGIRSNVNMDVLAGSGRELTREASAAAILGTDQRDTGNVLQYSTPLKPVGVPGAYRSPSPASPAYVYGSSMSPPQSEYSVTSYPSQSPLPRAPTARGRIPGLKFAGVSPSSSRGNSSADLGPSSPSPDTTPTPPVRNASRVGASMVPDPSFTYSQEVIQEEPHSHSAALAEEDPSYRADPADKLQVDTAPRRPRTPIEEEKSASPKTPLISEHQSRSSHDVLEDSRAAPPGRPPPPSQPRGVQRALSGDSGKRTWRLPKIGSYGRAITPSPTSPGEKNGSKPGSRRHSPFRQGNSPQENSTPPPAQLVNARSDGHLRMKGDRAAAAAIAAEAVGQQPRSTVTPPPHAPGGPQPHSSEGGPPPRPLPPPRKPDNPHNPPHPPQASRPESLPVLPHASSLRMPTDENSNMGRRAPPPRPPPLQPSLPTGWQRLETTDGQVYYGHTETGRTQWEFPTV